MPSIGSVLTPRIEDLLHVQLDHVRVSTRWVLEGLTDDEFLWQPTTPCWSVRPRDTGSVGWGAGEWICEDQWPPPDPVPVTSIAWRIVHLAAWIDIYRDWTFGSAGTGLGDFEVPPDAAGGLRWLFAAQDRFCDAVENLAEGEALELRPAHYGDDVPVVQLVTTIAAEQVHHVAEAGVLRDLRAGAARDLPPPPPIESPSWWAAQPGERRPETE